jgi:ATP-dependent RNA helicase SrmB
MEFQELELNELILKAIEKQGFKKPTKIQEEVIPNALSGFDVLGEAPTGTGKTAAFVIPCLQHLLDFPSKKLGLARVLILTPTRELAIQVTEHARAFCSELPNIKIGTIIGGVDHEEQLSVISEKTDIVVATPGRLLEYLNKKAFDIKAVEILVLDEADRMLDMGFVDDVIAISKQCSRREQTLLFSATLEGKILTKFANEILDNPVEIHIDSPRSEKKKIKQYKYYADDLEHKILLLEHLLKDPKIEKPIVFIKTRERLMDLSVRLQKDGFKHVFLKGEMEQSKRQEAIKKYSNNEIKILLSTDVAARGIDINDITHVINFDLPRSAEVYVHRIGRTARAGKKGIAINLIEAHDVPMLERIEHYTSETSDLRVIDSLRPNNKVADFSKKKKKDKDEGKNKIEKKKSVKVREKTKKEKGKPDFFAKKIAKLDNDSVSQSDKLEFFIENFGKSNHRFELLNLVVGKEIQLTNKDANDFDSDKHLGFIKSKLKKDKSAGVSEDDSITSSINYIKDKIVSKRKSSIKDKETEIIESQNIILESKSSKKKQAKLTFAKKHDLFVSQNKKDDKKRSKSSSKDKKNELFNRSNAKKKSK